MQKTARIFAGNANLKEGHGKLICSLEGDALQYKQMLAWLLNRKSS